MEFLTVGTLGNSLDYGELTLTTRWCRGSDGHRSICGGYGTGDSEVIDYITIGIIGTVRDFGNLLQD